MLFRAAAPVCRRETAMGNRMHISHLLTDEEMREVCARTGAGVESIEFSIAENLDRLQETIKSYDQRLSFIGAEGLILHGPFLDLVPSTWDRLVEDATRIRFGQCCEAAKALGASKVVFHTGFIPNANFVMGWAERQADFFRRFLEKHDSVEIVMENMYDPYAAPLADVVKLVDHPGFRLCLDFGHAHCFGLEPVPIWARTLLPYLSHVHVHDNHGSHDDHDHRDEHLSLGAGNVDLETVIRTIKEAPEVTVTFENNSAGDVLASWAFLKENGI